MSLVEQALARMRNQGIKPGGTGPSRLGPGSPAPGKPPAKRKRSESMPRQVSPSYSQSGDTAKLQILEAPEATKRMVLDLVAMRANGYLPEESKDRQFADHYRRIKRPLIDRALSDEPAGNDLRIIMITSALPGDGKTFTSVNLALSMALERDVSVLLVDCDVAKRHVSEIVGMKHEAGLLDALSDESIDVESLVIQTNIKGLQILPAGKPSDTTAELLSSKRMRDLIENLFANNPRRILLLDSPPLLITNEGRSLINIAGQIALVVRAGHTPRHAVQDALALFDPEKPGGLILNHVVQNGGEGFYGYDSYGLYGDYGADANKT